MAAGALHPTDNHVTTNAISPESAPASHAAAAVHQRTYQGKPTSTSARLQRKVRCDLGSVDNPHDPPCSRCKREAKECFFSATRRKKKTSSAEGDADSNPAASLAEPDEGLYEIRGNRKRLRSSAPGDYDDPREDSPEPPRTPGGSTGRAQPLRRPTQPKIVQYGEEAEKTSESTAALLQQAEVHGGHDALKVLYHAALRGRAQSSASSTGPPNFASYVGSPTAAEASPRTEHSGRPTSHANGHMPMHRGEDAWKPRTAPSAAEHGSTATPRCDTHQYASAIKAWSRFRFVRAGWFTAAEGIAYITYFYERLAPLTPVVLPDFKQPQMHKNLLEEEPMLAITMLHIASRHMKLDGPGSHSRPYAVHQKLWTYLSGMINRVMWGQEQFGGGFCGAGGQPGCDVNPLSRKGLRSLGSVESLVLLTEWHPRAMHFPPDEDDDELMLPDIPVETPDVSDNMDAPKGIGGQRMDAWLEPCWRSDRMCWMLLGQAMALAFEIGVFDVGEWRRNARASDGQPLSADKLQAYDKRRCNVRDLLLVYVTQTSGRLGLTSMLPADYGKPEQSSLFQRPLGQQESVQEVTLYFWLRMAALMREGNRQIFANKTFTRDLIRNGNYKAALERLQPPLQEWRREFDSCAAIPKYMRCILGIEYEYCRVYINALALQAVAERCANDHPSPVAIVNPPLESIRSSIADGARPDVAISPSTLSKWLGGDRNYLVTVGDAARNLLKIVVEELYPGGFLRHAPVRTYFRIISVAIMLLKSFSLGAFESDVTDSIHLLDQTVQVLRTCVVDDVHVASRFADLLDTLIHNLKPRLVRIAADGRTSRHRASNHPHASYRQTPRPPASTIQSPQQQHHPHLAHPSLSAVMHHHPYSGIPDGSPDGSHPLFGISNDTYDLMSTDNQFSVMPPPGFTTSSPNDSQTSAFIARVTNGSSYDGYPAPATSTTSSSHNPSNAAGTFDSVPTLDQDWLALPLDPLLGMSAADVHQTMYGPELNGQDMLELLLNGSGANPGFG